MKKTKALISALLTLAMCIALCIGINQSSAKAATGWTLSPNDFYIKMTAEEKAAFDYQLTNIERIELIKSAKEAVTIKIPKKAEVNTLDKYFMKALANNPYVTVDMTYEYDGTTYHVVIPAGKAEYSEDIDYYGPLYLVSKYGGTVVE